MRVFECAALTYGLRRSHQGYRIRFCRRVARDLADPVANDALRTFGQVKQIVAGGPLLRELWSVGQEDRVENLARKRLGIGSLDFTNLMEMIDERV